ncbi:MAG TPA: extracellular solute-binding protein [Longimicrobiaceae bacterium]
MKRHSSPTRRRSACETHSCDRRPRGSAWALSCTRTLRVCLLLALGGAVLDACGGDGREALIVYSPHGPDLLNDVEQRFEAAHPTIDLQWLDMGSQEVLDRIRSERANPQADVWYGGPSQLFAAAADDGLLAAHRPEWAELVAEHSDAEARYLALYYTPLVIAYNSEAVDSALAPRDWDDALDPRWRGQVLIRDPLASGTMRSIFGMIVERSLRATGDTAQGFDWLRRLDAQTREYVLNPTLLYQKLARQEGLITLWDMPDIEMLKATTGYPIDYNYARSGTPMVVDAVAVVANSPNSEAARAFVEFIGSSEEVLFAAREHMRLPVREDIPVDSLPPALRRAREEIVEEPMDWRLLQERGSDWMRYWDERVRGRG